MKRIKKYLSIYLSIFIVLCNIPLFHVNASELQNTFSLGSIEINGNIYDAFEYSNPALLPDTMQYYWVQNGKVQHAIASDMWTVIVNKRFGLAVKPSFLTSMLGYITAACNNTGSFATSLFTGTCRRVSNGNAVVGIALTDLTGYTLSDDMSGTSCTIPSEQVNILYDITNYYINEVDPSEPDYINIPCLTKAECLSNINPSGISSSEVTNTNDIINNLSSEYAFDWMYNSVINSNYSGRLGFYNEEMDNMWTGLLSYTSTVDYASAYQIADFNELVTNYNLTESQNTITKDQFLANRNGERVEAIIYHDGVVIDEYTYINSSDKATGTISNIDYQLLLYDYDAYSIYMPISNRGYITFYKSPQIVQQITNNVYQKNYYTSTTYNNYSTTNNNTTVIPETQWKSAPQTNETVYNNSQTTTNNNNTENNYYDDHSVNDNSVTNIINNYYGDNSGGDSGGDDDDDDDSIWDALLKALSGFLKKIGELLATILTGIIEICTDVLGAIASITESFSGITDFIGTIFGFIPSEIISVLTLGITLAVLISLIRLFRK